MFHVQIILLNVFISRQYNVAKLFGTSENQVFQIISCFNTSYFQRNILTYAHNIFYTVPYEYIAILIVKSGSSSEVITNYYIYILLCAF